MPDFIPRLYIDLPSFILGFVAGLLFLYLYRRFLPRILKATKTIRARLASIQVSASKNIPLSYARQAHKAFQSQHSFRDFFPLESISISASLIAPPPTAALDPDSDEPSLLHRTIPYLPDTPFLATAYSTPSLSIEEAASSGRNLCLIGEAGSGKTTALINFGVLLIKKISRFKQLNNRVPFYLDAQQVISQFPNRNVQDVLSAAFTSQIDFDSLHGYSDYLLSTLQQGSAMLLLDGMDCLSASEFDQVLNFVRVLTSQYPSVQIIITSGTDYLGKSVEFGFIPLGLESWNKHLKQTYLRKWHTAWNTLSPESPLTSEPIETLQTQILFKWLIHHTEHLSPFEFSALVFNVYSNTVSGLTPLAILEGFLAARFRSHPPQIMHALELCAVYVLDQQKTQFSNHDIADWLQNNKEIGIVDTAKNHNSPLERAFQSGVEKNLLKQIDLHRYSFNNLALAGVLSSRGITHFNPRLLNQIAAQPSWSMQTSTIKFISDPTTAANLFGEISKYFGIQKSLLVHSLNWLRYLPQNSSLRDGLLKIAAREIHSNHLTAVKTRLAATLASTGIKEAEPVINHLLQSSSAPVRRAAALAAGLLGRPKMVPQLIKLLRDVEPNNFAACYALGLIASPTALEAVADSLMHGSELLRRSAAEALSRHPSEGHPALREGSKMDDILVRYAVVHGLKQIKAPWSAEILDYMRIEDDQWVVRDAAQHAFEAISAPSTFIPRPPVNLTKTAWLTDLAPEHEISSLNDENCLELLLAILQEGSDENKQAALLALRQEGYTDIFPAIYIAMRNASSQTLDEAETTLWYTSRTGKAIPLPSEYNLS